MENNKKISYPYAYGRLDAGVRNFTTHFKNMAIMKGINLDSETIEYMEKMLIELADDTYSDSVKHYKKFNC